MSDMDSVSAKLRDKRNRLLERETNELKDELCAMKHIVHLLDNIKRVSSDCIQYLHLMVDAAVRTDNNQMDQLKDDVQELEDELKAWERKYHMMSQMQAMPDKMNSVITSSKTVVNNLINNKITHKLNANNDTNDSIEANGVDPSERYEVSANGSYYDSDRNEDCAQSSHNALMAQELCEMSMETNDNEPVQINSAEGSPHSSHQRSGSPSLELIPILVDGVQDLSSGKSLFECDWNGCDFRTNMRQRLVMHKRLHAGEMLFSCDIPGCGYQSNYKGNIKIHKKHRHRIDSDDNKEYSPLIINTQNSSNSNHSTINLSHHLIKNNNFSSNLIRKRKRKKKFRFTVSRSNVKNVGGQLDADPNAQPAKQPERISSLFTCTVKGCNYRSKWKQCLTAHQLLHAGVKPFKCDHPGCNYRTNFKGNVNVHKRVHRESQYQCQVNGCQFSTPWKNSFNQHQRNHIINGNTETTLNIDNHIELHSEDNDYDDEDVEREDSSPGQTPVELSVQRIVLNKVVPSLPVPLIQNLCTNGKIEKQRKCQPNPMPTKAKPVVPPMVGVIKSIKSEF